MADWNKPVATDAYASWPALIRDRDDAAATMFDAAVSNTPTGAIRFDVAAQKFQRYTGSAFADQALSVAGGGTGAATAAAARSNLGLGSIATQSSATVTITGGAIDGTTVGATTPATGRFTTVRADTVSHTIRFGQNTTDQPGSGNAILGGAMNWDATAGTGGASLFISKGQYWSLLLNNNTGAGDQIQLFALGGTVKSTIAIDTAGIAISNCTATPPSDHRLKDVLGPIEDAAALLMKLDPLWYRWKHTGQRDIGFLAHALQEVLPCTATGRKDDVWDESGPRAPDGRLLNPVGQMKPQSWKPDRLIPLLTAGFQDHERRLARVEALEREVRELRAAIARMTPAA